MISDSDFAKVVQLEIDNLGGGYFDPSMFADGRLDPKWKTLYGVSGETMFDFDRINGPQYANTPDGKKFWALIDAAEPNKVGQKWPWNYGGGSLAPKLKALIPGMIKPYFEQLCNINLSKDSLKIVESDKRFAFYFLYSTYNGPGWFAYFAGVMNYLVAKKKYSNDELMKLMIQIRTESNSEIIREGAPKLVKIFEDAFFL